MKNKISIAIIGGGLNSAVGYAHFSAINLSNKFKIVAGSFSKPIKKVQMYMVLHPNIYIRIIKLCY